jgi:6-phosphogluconate dehydrogenase
VADEKAMMEARSAIERVAKDTGVTAEQQLEVFRLSTSIVGKQLDIMHTVVDKIGQARIEREISKREIKKYETMEKIAMEHYSAIKEQYAILREVLSAHFAERRATIDKGFEIIDKGIRENNYELVLKTFGDIATIVAKSPLAEVAESVKMMESGNTRFLEPI